MKTLFENIFSKSISRILMLSFILLLILPLFSILPSLNKNTSNEIYQENLTKHQLMASSIAELIKLHIQSQQRELQFLDSQLQQNGLNDPKKNHLLIKNLIDSNKQLIAVSFLSVKEKSIETKINTNFHQKAESLSKDLEYILSEKKYRLYDKDNSISAAFKSTITKKPAILLRHHIIDKEGEKLGTLMAEIDLSFLTHNCNQITFGSQGHCTVVDNDGKIIAHPNTAWVSNSKNLSTEATVIKLQQTMNGSLKYFSASNNTEMLAGFAKVAPINWGVIVSQPEAEIVSPFAKIKSTIFTWASLGLISAIFIAFFVIQIITSPLRKLVAKSKDLETSNDSFRLGKAPDKCTKDIKSLWNQLAELTLAYQSASEEVHALSCSSSKDIHKVVVELRKKNLNKPHNIDPLTGITNQQCFTLELEKSLRIHIDEYIGIISFEISNYSYVVTAKGQEAGNEFLKHVATIIDENLRTGDMVMHFKDTNRFAIFIDNCDEKSLQGTAHKLHELIESSAIIWKDEPLSPELSMGLLIETIDENSSAEQLIIEAEQAIKSDKQTSQNSKAIAA